MKHTLVVAFWICLGSCGSLGQSVADYNTLIQQGEAQLKAGNNDAAGSSAATAIKLNPDRWEAYALAGGVMINRHNCEAANHFLTAALKRAPAEKQTGIQNLMDQCQNPVQAAPANTSPSSSPTLQETSDWLAKTLKLYGSHYYTDGPLEREITDARIGDDCTFHITQTFYAHPDDDHPKRRVSSSMGTSTVPLGAVTGITLGRPDHNAVDIVTYPVSAILLEVGGPQQPSAEIDIDLMRRPDLTLGGEVPMAGSEVRKHVAKALSHAVDLCRGTYAQPGAQEPF